MCWPVSCAPAGSCAAGGSYPDRSGHPRHFQGYVTQGCTRPRSARSAGPFSATLGKRT